MRATRLDEQAFGRTRRVPFVFLLLGILGVLASGSAVLGILPSPARADAATHDVTFVVRHAAARTLRADRVVGTYCYAKLCKGSRPFVYRFSYTAPDTSDMFATHGRRVVGGSRCSGACARRVGDSVLQPVLALSAFPRFTLRGGLYESTEVPGGVFTRAVDSEAGGASRLGGALTLVVQTLGNEKGDVSASARVFSGYVVAADLHVVVDVQGSGQPPGFRGDHQWVIPVRFTQVGSWRQR